MATLLYAPLLLLFSMNPSENWDVGRLGLQLNMLALFVVSREPVNSMAWLGYGCGGGGGDPM